MHLTSQQEGQLIEKHTKLIWKVVNRFIKANGNPLISKDECFQECAIVLLKKIRAMESLKDLETGFPFMEMRYAMQMHILNSLSMRYPRTTRRLGEIARLDFEKTPYRIEGSTIPDVEVERTVPDNMEEVPFKVDFERFLSRLSDRDRQIVEWKLSGAKNTDIAARLGYSNAKITRILHAIRKSFDLETGIET